MRSSRSWRRRLDRRAGGRAGGRPRVESNTERRIIVRYQHDPDDELALLVYAITDEWPVCERYQLTAQLRRAALSVPTNIAEGAAKRGSREFRRYLDIARGSLSEVAYLLQFSKDRGLIDEESFNRVHHVRDRAGKLTWGLYSSLNQRTNGRA